MSLKNLYEKYHQQVQFLMIYIREAHPVDGWWLGGGVAGVALNIYEPRAASDISDPKTIAERRGRAMRRHAEFRRPDLCG